MYEQIEKFILVVFPIYVALFYLLNLKYLIPMILVPMGMLFINRIINNVDHMNIEIIKLNDKLRIHENLISESHNKLHSHNNK